MMNTTDTHDPDGGWRELAEGLHGLRAEPPATLAPAVLERVGLADAYLSVDGPAGPLLVAYNGRGISATAPARTRPGSRAVPGPLQAALRPAGRPPERLVAQVERLLTPGAGRPAAPLRPARHLRVRAGRAGQGPGDPPRPGAAVRLGGRRARPAGRGPGGRGGSAATRSRC